MNLGRLLKELSEHWQRDLIFALVAALIVDFVFKGPIRKFFILVFTRIRDLTAGKRFEQNYRDWLISRFRFLNVRGIKAHAPVTVELEQVFVTLRTKKPPERQDALPEESETELLADSDKELREFLERTLLRKEERGLLAEGTYELENLFSLPQKRFIIIGKPGSGKTTLLSFLALKFARRSSQGLLGVDNETLPVFVNLRDTIKQGFLNVKAFGEKYGSYIECPHSTPTGFFKQRLDDGKCIVLLDGLDEVSKPRERIDVAGWIDKLTSAYPKNVFIATSRPYGYETARLYNDFLELHILEFTSEQVEEFVRYWTKAVEIKARGDDSRFTLEEAEKRAEDLLKAIRESPKIEVLTTNPLLLTIVSLVHRYRATLPKRRVELYQECCDILLGYWDVAKGITIELEPTQKRAILQPLAYHLHHNGLREEKADKLIELLRGELPKIGVDKDKAKSLLDDFRYRCGIVVETRVSFFGFAHLTFQEFLTARYILDNNLEGFLVARRRDKYWLEATLLYCGMKDTSTLLRRILHEREDIFHSNLLAAGRCLAESLSVTPELRRHITNELLDVCQDESEFDQVKKAGWQILRKIREPQTVQGLIDETKDKERDDRKGAVYGIRKMQAREAVMPLNELLKDEENDARGSTANASGQLRAREIVPRLIEILRDEERDVRWLAADVLGRLKAREAVPPLIELLKDKHNYLRASAAHALGQIHAKQAVPPLIELLKDIDSRVRGHAVYALGQIQTKQAVPPVIELLKDTDSWVRGHAADALGKIQDKEAVLPLIELLKDEEGDVRARAADALRQIQAKEAVPLLTELLKDKESDVRGYAADVLGTIHAKEAVLPLIELLKDKKSGVRGRAAEALGKIGEAKAVEPLKSLLTEKEVRESAFEALRKISEKTGTPIYREQ